MFDFSQARMPAPHGGLDGKLFLSLLAEGMNLEDPEDDGEPREMRMGGTGGNQEEQRREGNAPPRRNL